jgi:hypothetical protein
MASKQANRGGVQVGGVYLPADVAVALRKRVQEIEPATTAKGVIVAALRAYLRIGDSTVSQFQDEAEPRMLDGSAVSLLRPRRCPKCQRVGTVAGCMACAELQKAPQ